MKKKILWKKAYTDKDGMTHIPIKNQGRKKYRCDECGKKVREVFTINPTEILLRRELCRACYCKTHESLDELLSLVDNDENFDGLSASEIRDNLSLVDNDLTRKESKPYLCQICKLKDTCLNDFDYECVEASDFLYRKGDKDDYKRVVKELEKIYTVKDDFLDSLTDKDHNALRG